VHTTRMVGKALGVQRVILRDVWRRQVAPRGRGWVPRAIERVCVCVCVWKECAAGAGRECVCGHGAALWWLWSGVAVNWTMASLEVGDWTADPLKKWVGLELECSGAAVGCSGPQTAGRPERRPIKPRGASNLLGRIARGRHDARV
jgi:hypothetical protein